MGWTLVCGLKALGKLVELWVEKHIQTEQGEGKEVGEENEGMKGVSRRKGEIEKQEKRKEGREKKERKRK